MHKLIATLALMLLMGACATSNRPLQLISGAGPVYPSTARAQGIQGEVVVQYDVNVEGQVINARVISSEPAEIFDQSALQAVRSWRFNAPLINGQRQPARNRRSTVTFQLDGADRYDKY